MSNQPTSKKYAEQSVNAAAQDFFLTLRNKHTNQANAAYADLLESRKQGNAEAMSSAQERLDFHGAAEDKAHALMMSLEA